LLRLVNTIGLPRRQADVASRGVAKSLRETVDVRPEVVLNFYATHMHVVGSQAVVGPRRHYRDLIKEAIAITLNPSGVGRSAVHSRTHTALNQLRVLSSEPASFDEVRQSGPIVSRSLNQSIERDLFANRLCGMTH